MWNITDELITRKYNNHKQCAKKRRIKCTLTKEQLTHVFKTNKGICDYTGKGMCIYTAGVPHEYMPTLERISDEGIYEVSNIALVRNDINQLKRNILETKNSWKGKGGLDIETKKMVGIMCETLYNPEKLNQLKEKYSLQSEQSSRIVGLNRTQNNTITKEEQLDMPCSKTNKSHSEGLNSHYTSLRIKNYLLQKGMLNLWSLLRKYVMRSFC